MLKISPCFGMLFRELPFTDRIKAAAGAGAKAFEFWDWKGLDIEEIVRVKDDLGMELNGHSLKKSGSQGQQKTFLVALKLAESEFIGKLMGTPPILLLDDIFDKFDAGRVKQIIRLVAENQFGQIFITDTNEQRLQGILKEIPADHKVFRITSEATLQEIKD